jgi:hypothetical protein
MNNDIARSFSSDFLAELISFSALCDVRMRRLIEDTQRLVKAFLYVKRSPVNISIASLIYSLDLLVLSFP